MRKLSFLLALSAIVFSTAMMSSCKSNQCKENICIRGECVEGVCDCIPGYEGDDCYTKSSDKFIGVYNVETVCDNQFEPVHFSTLLDAVNGKVEIDNFNNSGETLVGYANGQTITFDYIVDNVGRIDGTGVLSPDGENIYFTYDYYFSGVIVDECTLIFSRQ